MKKLSILLAGTIAIFLSCNKEETTDREYPRLNTLDVTDVSPDGATFHAEILYNRNFEIKKYGFVWSENPNPNIQGSDKVEIDGAPSGQKFSSRISTSLQKDIEYKVRAFIITDRLTVYGQEESFISLGSRAPEILAIEPSLAAWKDTVKITGKNFSKIINSNKFYFGGNRATILHSTNHSNSDSIIYVTVPIELRTPKTLVSVNLAGNTYVYTQDTFSLKLPFITSIAPETGTWKDEIELRGYFPSRNHFDYTVAFDNTESVISYSNDSLLKVVVPENLEVVSTTPIIKVNGMFFQYSGRFKLSPPEIISISSNYWWKYAAVEILLKNTKINRTTMKMGNVSLSIGSHYTADSIHSLFVYAPELPNSGVYPVNVRVLGQTYEFPIKINYVHPVITSVTPNIVTFLDTLNIHGDFRGAGSSINVTLGPTNYLNPVFFTDYNDTLIKAILPTTIGNFDGRVLVEGSWGTIERSNAFQIKKPTITSITVSEPKYGGIVTLRGDNFNPAPLSQHQNLILSDENISIPISSSKTELVYSLGYSFASVKTLVLSGVYGQVSTNTSINFVSPFSNPSSTYINEYFFGHGFHGAIEDKGYLGTYFSIYRYNSNNRSWTKRIDLPRKTKNSSFFTIEDKIYYVSGQSNDVVTGHVYEYNPALNTIAQKNFFPGTPRSCGYGFAVGGKGYIIGGFTEEWSSLNDFWEYDPNTDNWTQLQNLPYSHESQAYPTVFVIDDKAYLLATGPNGYASFWSYSTTSNIWEAKAAPSNKTGFFPTTFVIENEGYLIPGDDIPFNATNYGLVFVYKYNPTLNTWSQKYRYLGIKAESRVSFVFDNKAHLGLGAAAGYPWGFYSSIHVYNPLLDN